MAAARTAAIPKGFRKVETSIGGFWKPERVGQCLQGVVGHTITATGNDGKPNEFYTLKLTDALGGPIVAMGGKTVKHHTGMIVGVGGKALLTFLREHEGREVFLQYRGLGEAKKGFNAPKLYDCFVRESESDIPE